MKTNTLAKIGVKNTYRPRVLCPASNDLNTTADFGDFQPIKFKRMLANSSMTVKMKDLVRAAPLVAPSFARLQQKVFSYFVPYTDVSQNYTHMMAQEPVRRGSTTFVPTNIPTISRGRLSSLILIGAKCTVYLDSDGDGSPAHYSQLFDVTGDPGTGSAPSLSQMSSDIQKAWSILDQHIFTYFAGSVAGSAFGFSSNQALLILNVGPIAGVTGSYFRIVLSNDSVASLFAVNPSDAYYKSKSSFTDLETVPLKSADIVLPLKVDYVDSDGASQTAFFSLAFRLSSFGKRLRKIIQGLGYAIDLSSEEKVDFLAFIAYYKAYFEGFAPKLYASYETTHAYNLQWYADQAVNNYDFDSLYLGNCDNDFWQFIIDLGQCFYTDDQDFVSAHIRSTAVSPSPEGMRSSIDTDIHAGHQYEPAISTSDVSNVEHGNLAQPNGHVYINSEYHGQLDSELLKKLYLWTNRNTIAGRKVSDLLRAQGLGSYVDAQKSTFIGYAEHMIPISDVTSTSDTFDAGTGTGSLLGEQNGKAVEYTECDSWTYETAEAGYWFTMLTIVPVSGYCEQQDPTSTAVSKWTMYNPDFDGLGYEFTKKNAVHGSMHWQDFDHSGSGSLDDSFGLIPRYTGWKITNNLINGDFNLRSKHNAMLPYTLDKFINVGERYVDDGKHSGTTTRYVTQKSFTPSDLPIAGVSWRYLTKYPFIGLYTRIFANIGNDGKANAENWFLYAADWTFFSQHYDHFIVQGIFDGKYYAPVLPFADSFETKDEGNEGKANASMSKA